MRFWLFLCLCFALGFLGFSHIVWAQETQLPLPRFASLNSGEVNLRTGPGTRYPITWVYHQKGLPVEIVREFETWRQVKDLNGDQGWLHQSMLSGQRMALVTTPKDNATPKTLILRKSANSNSAVVAKLKPHVLVELQQCTLTWCEVAVQGFVGWAPKTHLWGVYDAEQWD